MYEGVDFLLLDEDLEGARAWLDALPVVDP